MKLYIKKTIEIEVHIKVEDYDPPFYGSREEPPRGAEWGDVEIFFENIDITSGFTEEMLNELTDDIIRAGDEALDERYR